MDSTNVGTFKGVLSSEQMGEIEEAVSKIIIKEYYYNDPEFTLDSGKYEVGIKIGESFKIFQTDNATENFSEDILNLLYDICEKISVTEVGK